MVKVYAIGVGPGSPECLTEVARRIISDCDIVVGYQYTLQTIQHLLKDQEVHVITMVDQEETYQKVHSRSGDKTLVVPFTGDASFSESEVVDRLAEIFGNITIVSGISSVQEAAAKSRVPLDKSRVITLHVTTSIEEKKLDLLKAIIDGYSVVLVPRPWPKIPDKNFMPSEIAHYLKKNGINTSSLKVNVFESITTNEETHFVGIVDDLMGMEFSPLSVMVFDQTKADSYMNYKWQWKN